MKRDLSVPGVPDIGGLASIGRSGQHLTNLMKESNGRLARGFWPHPAVAESRHQLLVSQRFRGEAPPGEFAPWEETCPREWI